MAKRAEISNNDVVGKTLMLLTQTTRLTNKYIDAYFYEKAPISFTKYLALKILASKKEPMNPSELAEWTHTELHNVTTLVVRLKRDGFITTQRSDVDKRSVNIIITEKGRKALEESMHVARDLISRIMSSIKEPEAVKCSQMLQVLKENARRGFREIYKNK